MNVSSRTRNRTLKISTKRQWQAIASPVRLQIVSLLESMGQQSVAELAENLSLPADSLYHHIRILLKAKLVAEKGFRKTTRAPEAVYELAADQLDFDVDLKLKKNCEYFDKLNQVVLRSMGRLLTAAAKSGSGVIAGNRRNVYARFETAWLDAQELKKVREHIEAISEIFRKSRQSKGRNSGALMVANCNLAPAERSSRDP